MPALRKDPQATPNFRVELDGIPVAEFTECSGLSSETEVITYQQGGDPTLRLMPGRTTYSPIVLTRGLVVDRSLWTWRRQIATGHLDRRNGSVVLLGPDGAEAARWNFHNGWPSKWRGPVLNSQSNEVAVESLEIVHEGFDWVS